MQNKLLKAGKTLQNFLKESKNKKTLIVTHSSADIDAIASCSAFYCILKKFHSIPSILIPEHINQHSKKLAEYFKIPYSTQASIKEFDSLLILELNSFDMLGSYAQPIREFNGKKMLIDHHKGSVEQIASPNKTFIFPEFVSLTELLFELFSISKIKIDKKISIMLQSGIITDSAMFHAATPKTFETMSKLCKASKTSIGEIINIFEIPVDSGEKIAKLKSAQRAKIFKADNFVFCSTMVSAFEANSAAMLCRISADAAFACAQEKENLRISARANPSFFKKTGISLASIMESLGKKFSGTGGGHDCAAAFNGKGNPEQALKECIMLLFEEIKKQNPKAKLKEME